MMGSDINFRPATLEDCSFISLLQTYATGGVAEALVHGIVPGVAATELIGRFFAQATLGYSYRNSTIVDVAGKAAGHIVLFPFGEDKEAEIDLPIPDNRWALLKPFEILTAPNSYYVASIAVLPEHRRQGLGGALLDLANERACEFGFKDLSLHVFEQNGSAVELYQRHGYRIVDRYPVVPHQLIRYSGDVLLMTAPVPSR